MSSEIKDMVKERYGAIAEKSTAGGCCGGPQPQEAISKTIGYSEEEIGAVPEGANLGLGCGNPLGLASIEKGQTVLDLGSGAGFDSFLAANRVGDTGTVIGVDMTDSMLEKARANATKGGYENVEFRKGEIEDLPVEDASIDIITSNCVINLSPDKKSVFKEAHRVLKTGGSAFISDIVLTNPLPEVIAKSVGMYAACVSGAMQQEEYLQLMRDAGFSKVEITSEKNYPIDAFVCDSTITDSGLFKEVKDLPKEVIEKAAKSIVSVQVHATK